MPLHMGNITDDKTEELLAFTRRVAGLLLYWTELDPETCDPDDGYITVNDLIEEARTLLK